MIYKCLLLNICQTSDLIKKAFWNHAFKKMQIRRIQTKVLCGLFACVALTVSVCRCARARTHLSDNVGRRTRACARTRKSPPRRAVSVTLPVSRTARALRRALAAFNKRSCATWIPRDRERETRSGQERSLSSRVRSPCDVHGKANRTVKMVRARSMIMKLCVRK